MSSNIKPTSWKNFIDKKRLAFKQKIRKEQLEALFLPIRQQLISDIEYPLGKNFGVKNEFQIERWQRTKDNLMNQDNYKRRSLERSRSRQNVFMKNRRKNAMDLEPALIEVPVIVQIKQKHPQSPQPKPLGILQKRISKPEVKLRHNSFIGGQAQKKMGHKRKQSRQPLQKGQSLRKGQLQVIKQEKQYEEAVHQHQNDPIKDVEKIAAKQKQFIWTLGGGFNVLALNRKNDQYFIGAIVRQQRSFYFTTRCVVFPYSLLGQMISALKKVFKAEAPTVQSPVEQTCCNKSIIISRDIYKGVQYFGIRMLTYYAGEPFRTRNGVNINWINRQKIADLIKALEKQQRIIK